MFHVFVMAYPTNVFVVVSPTIFLCFASYEPEGVPQRKHECVPYHCEYAARVEYIRVLSFKFFFSFHIFCLLSRLKECYAASHNQNFSIALPVVIKNFQLLK